MFADAGGTVHPIRNSPGYDVLEERAAAVTAHRARQEEEAQEEERADPRAKLEAIREWEAIRRALPRGISRSRQGGKTKGTESQHYTYDREEIPEDLYRVGGVGVDVVGERLVPVVGDRAERWDERETLAYLQRARRRYVEAVDYAGRGGHHRARDAGRALARRRILRPAHAHA